MIGFGAASAFGYGDYFEGNSQLFQDLAAHPENYNVNDLQDGILSGGSQVELNLVTLGLYGLTMSAYASVTTGDYTSLQDSSLNMLLLNAGLRGDASAPIDSGPAGAVNAPSVFWTGRGSQAVAETYSAANGAQTLSMSSFALANNATLFEIQSASTAFAKAASGDVQVFQPAAGIPVDSVWSQFEYPTLMGSNLGIILYKGSPGNKGFSEMPQSDVDEIFSNSARALEYLGYKTEIWSSPTG